MNRLVTTKRGSRLTRLASGSINDNIGSDRCDPDEVTHSAHVLDRIFDGDRYFESRRHELVARTIGALRETIVDRHAHAQPLDRHAHRVVIAIEPVRDRDDERVVELGVRDPGCGLQRAHIDIERMDAARGGPALHQRGQRLDTRARGTTDRAHHSSRSPGRGGRVFAQAVDDFEAALEELFLPLRLVPQRAPESLRLVEDDDVGFGRHVELGGFRLEVDELEQQAHRADTVDDGVVQLGDERGLPVDQILDHDELPQGPIAVEALRDHGLDERDDVVEGVVPAGGREAHVVREVEVRVELPPWGRDRIRVPYNSLAQSRDVAGGPIDALPDTAAIGGPVEQRDRGDGATQQWVLLDHPHDAIEVRHPIVVAHGKSLDTGGEGLGIERHLNAHRCGSVPALPAGCSF